MVCRCGPRATTAPMVCHHGPHAISSPPLCHGGARGAVPPTPTARCPRCAQSLCRVLCCPPRHLALRGDTADPPRAGMGTHVGLGWQPQPPPSAWGQGATRPYSAGADTPVGFLWGGRGAGYRTPFCAPPHPLGALLAAGGAEENAFGKQRPGSHGAGEGGARGGLCRALGGVVGLEGGSLRPDAPISLQRVGMPRAAHPTAAPTAEPRSPPRPPPQPPPEPAARMELELLDLSFLTEAERCAIAEVLHRDALLRRTEEGRVRWDPPGPPVGGDRRGVSPGGSRTQWEAAAVPSLGHVPSTSSVSPTRSASPTCAVTSPHPHLCPPVLICHQPFYVPQLVRVPNFICAPSTSAVPPPV